MRVALNLVYLVPGETGGMETYARALVPAMAVARLLAAAQRRSTSISSILRTSS